MSGARQVSDRAVWRGRRARLFVHALLATTSLSVILPQAVIAQTAAPTVSATRTYNIPSQSLDSALAAFSRIAGVQVLNRGATTRGVTSPGINGTFTPQEAVSRLLAGTGLTPRFVGAGTVTLERPNSNVAGGAATVPGAIQLDQIDVQGAGNPNSTMTPMPAYAGGQVATGGQVGLLGNRNVMDTPFNQTSYTQKTIQDQQARTIEDVLINDPSVKIDYPSTSGYAARSVRGFSMGYGNDAVTLNGLSGILPSDNPTSSIGVERVEVLKGPSALLNGMPVASAIGGSVNLVSKRAPDEPLTQLTTSYVSRSQLGTHLDVGRRFGDNKEFGLRFNGSYSDGGGPVAPTNQKVGVGVLGLDYRGERVRVSADLGYQESDKDITRFIFLAPGIPIPRPPDANKNFVPSWNNYKTKDLYGTIQGEVDVTDNVTAYAAIGARRSDQSVVGLTPTVSNRQGDWQGSPISQTLYGNALSALVGLRASVDTGPINHALSVSVSRSESDFGYAFAAWGGAPYTSNLYNPRYLPNPNLVVGDPRKSSESGYSSVGIADTLSILDKRIQFTVGVRRQQVEAANFDTVTGARTDGYDANAWSPAYALVVKPWENVSLYANYIEGLEPGTIVGPFYANAGQVFPPYQSKQYEVGMKVDWGTVTTTVSAFQIARPSTINIPGTPLPTLALSGEQVNRGIEFNVFGELMPGFRVLGGATFMDARRTKTANGTYDGKKVAGVPDLNLVLGAEWDTPFVRDFTLTGRVNYQSATFFDQANVLAVPAWTRVDLGARYTFAAPWNNKPITIRFNVENVFDKNYWLNSGGLLYLAEPRTYRLSTTFNF